MANDHERIFDKLDEISKCLAGVCATCPQRQKDIDELRRAVHDLEAVQNKAAGVVAVVSIVLGSIGAVVTAVIKKVMAA